jgi:hypothetical protein
MTNKFKCRLCGKIFSENIEEILLHIKTKHGNKKELFLIELTKLSLRDLEASELLYAAGLYPQTVFYLQQSVEKFTKAMGIKYGIVTEKDLRSIGHLSIRIILNGMRTLGKNSTDPVRYRMILESMGLNKGHVEELMKAKLGEKDIIDDLKSDLDKEDKQYFFFKRPYENINKLLNLIEECGDFAPEKEENIGSVEKPKEPDYNQVTYKVLRDILLDADNDSAAKKIKKLVEEKLADENFGRTEHLKNLNADQKLAVLMLFLMGGLVYFYRVLTVLYSFNLITYKQESLSRYPGYVTRTSKMPALPTAIYDDDLGIIKAYPRIADLLLKSILSFLLSGS